ncbi:Arsenate reductase [Streptomyces sp. enrichment culture]
MADKPSVLFVCVHNAGRSQMAAAWLTHLAGDRVEVRSAGSAPGDRVNPAAVAAMAEVGIDISAETPKLLTVDAVRESDVCITMGCGDACPVFPGKRYLDWKLDDPAGQGVEAVQPIRDEIRVLVEGLISEIAPAGPQAPARCAAAFPCRAPPWRKVSRWPWERSRPAARRRPGSGR